MSKKRPRRLSDEQKIQFEGSLKDILTIEEVAKDPTRVWSVWAYRTQIGGSPGLYSRPMNIKPEYGPHEPSIFEEGLKRLSRVEGFCDLTVLSDLESRGRKILEDELAEGGESGVDRTKAVRAGLLYAIKEAADSERVLDCLRGLASVFRENPRIDEAFKPYHPIRESNGALITKEHKIALREVLRNYEAW